MRYYTVNSPTPADLSAAYTSLQGTDDQGVEWALIKLRDSDPTPVWGGTAIELMDDEWQVAAQSSLYRPVLGPLYRAAATEVGTELVEGFITEAAGLPTALADRLLQLLSNSALAGIEGFVPLLRYQIATTAPIDSIGWTAAAQATLLVQIDAWLAKFPAQASALPLATPQPQFGSLSQANDGDTLDVGGQYAVLTSAAAFTVSLPVWASQSSRVPTPIVIENLSGSDVTLEVNAADATTTYAGIGGSSVTLAGGERGELRTALDGAAQVWVLRTI